MKVYILICAVFGAFILFACSEAFDNKNNQLFQIKRGQTTEVDESADLHDDNNNEEIENNRRGSPDCEPCGIFRISCCFPNLCQHRHAKPSKCLRVDRKIDFLD